MGNKTITIMKEMVMNSGGYNVSSAAIKNQFNKNVLDKNKVIIEKMAKRFIKKITENKVPLFSKLYTKIAVTIFLKPLVYKDRENNQALINSWKDKKLV
jgi:hypothetical protein